MFRVIARAYAMAEGRGPYASQISSLAVHNVATRTSAMDTKGYSMVSLKSILDVGGLRWLISWSGDEVQYEFRMSLRMGFIMRFFGRQACREKANGNIPS